jgi:transposase
MDAAARVERIEATAGPVRDQRGPMMKTAEDVAEMLRLAGCGWGAKRIGRHLGCSHHTVKTYLASDGLKSFKVPARAKLLDGHGDWLRERFHRHRGNADVVRQELAAEKGLCVSLRTVQRAVAVWRQAMRAEALATVRFETRPGEQLQIDFGERFVEIGGQPVKVYVFVATLGYSRRLHVRAFRSEKQENWFSGLESAFTAFGGVTEEVLIDNPRSLVSKHDPVTGTVTFNPTFLAFAKHWKFKPRACQPYRARTKGKTENGVGYVKKNALAGRRFAAWDAFEAHLAQWEREVANERSHGTTEEAPMLRFQRDEAHRLKPLGGRPAFGALRELTRVVTSECAVEVDTNSYSVPWRLIGERVAVTVSAGMVRIRHGSRQVAEHKEVQGRRQRIIDPAHLAGVAGAGIAGSGQSKKEAANGNPAPPAAASPPQPSLLRTLTEYEAAIGGGF